MLVTASKEHSSCPPRIKMVTRFTVQALSHIDTLMQEVGAQIFVEGHMTDEATGEVPNIDESFDPQLDYINGKGELADVTPGGGKHIEKKATEMCFRWTASGTWTSDFDLTQFPNDVQKLTFEFTCNLPCRNGPKTSAQEIFLVPDIARSCVMPSGMNAVHSTWDMRQLKVIASESDISESGSGKVYSRIRLELEMARKPGWYIWNVMVPTCFLTLCCSFCAVSSATEEAGDRIANVITLLLTTAAYKIVVASKLPDIAYLTHLDKYILAGFGMSILIIIETTLCYFLVKWGSDSVVVDRVDGWFIGVWTVVWLLMSIFMRFRSA